MKSSIKRLDPPFTCQQCEFTTTWPASVVLHNKKHSGGYNKLCKHCNKQFNHSKLSRHEKPCETFKIFTQIFDHLAITTEELAKYLLDIKNILIENLKDYND